MFRREEDPQMAVPIIQISKTGRAIQIAQTRGRKLSANRGEKKERQPTLRWWHNQQTKAQFGPKMINYKWLNQDAKNNHYHITRHSKINWLCCFGFTTDPYILIPCNQSHSKIQIGGNFIKKKCKNKIQQLKEDSAYFNFHKIVFL